MVSVLRPGQRILNIPGIGVQTSRRAASVAAAADWWAVTGKTCVAAYQAIGAADYATSKINLANPGTYNAGNGTSYPTWASATGWAFDGSSQYLTTGIIPVNNQAWSAFCRFSNGGTANEECLFGLHNNSGTAFNIYSRTSAAIDQALFRNGGSLSSAPSAASGVFGMAGNTAYRDGASVDAIPAGSGTITIAVILGAINYSPILHHFSGNMQAFAIYSDTLTGPQVATVSAAMAAL